MPTMILRRKFDSVVVYPSDRASQKEFFDDEQQANSFVRQNYKNVEIIRRDRPRANRPRARHPRPQRTGLTLGYFYAQAVAKKAEEGAK